MSIFLRLLMIPILLVGIIGFSAGPAYALDSVIYVDINANGAGDGTSWTDAYTDLQSALLSAPPAGTQVWVAGGTYYPVSNPSNPPTELEKSATFQLMDGVGIYGGFAGTEGTLDERDPSVNVTILSGDIGVPSNSDDNIFHVVTGSVTDSTAVLDGFTITAGNAIEDPAELNGGGILNVGGSPTISNMVISNNEGVFGGGMFNYNGASPTVTNVTFSGNSAVRGAGMYNNTNSSPTVTNVTFATNTASFRGGGMTTSGGTPTLRNVTFYGNSAPKGGAMHNAANGDPTLINVTFSENTASEDGESIFNDFSDPVIINSILYNDNAGSQEEIFNNNSTPIVSYSIVQGGYTGTGNLNVNPLLGSLQDNGGYTQTIALLPGSPAIDAGDDVNCPAADQRGLTRPQGTHCDMGAYEIDNVPPTTSLDSYPPDPDSDNTPTFTFSGDDGDGSGVASFLCRMDGGSYIPCTSPFTSAPLSAGSHTFDVYAVDNASNADQSPETHTWTLAFTPTLVSSIVRADASPTSAASVNFTVTFSANVTGVGTGDFQLTTIGASGASITGVSGSNTTYTVSVNTGTTNGTIRLDIPNSADIDDSFGNSPTNLPYTTGQTYTINKTGTFQDVPNDHWAWRWIEGLYYAGVTSGCGSGNYCPSTVITRDQMAVFLLRAKYGSSYSPPLPSGVFQDVPTDHWAAAWIERLAAEGITSGCGSGNYCPSIPITRDQMAVFLLRAKYGSSYSPPLPSGVFQDVPTDHWAAAWIERLAAEGITSGCGSSNYCPTTPVTRDQMAVFLLRTFSIPPLP